MFIDSGEPFLFVIFLRFWFFGFLDVCWRKLGWPFVLVQFNKIRGRFGETLGEVV